MFGFFHGFGLATKLQKFTVVGRESLVTDIPAFNIGVEPGRLLPLSAILIAMGLWRYRGGFLRHAFAATAFTAGSGRTWDPTP